MNFLCSVSPKFPENYLIGVNGRRWGVEEKYEARIRRTKRGDLLLFSLGTKVRSLHLIESDVFREDDELWPEKDGSIFPFRIRISAPIAVGEVPLSEVAGKISFMQEMEGWRGTIRGRNGVFNDRLTDADVELIRSRMHDQPMRDLPKPTAQMPRFPLKLFETQVEQALLDLLDELGCERVVDIRPRRAGEPADHFTLVGRHRLRRETLILVLDGGTGSSSVLLHALHDMSFVRQHSDARTNIRGLILTGRETEELSLVAREIRNLSVRRYQLRLKLDPDPNEKTGGERGVA